MSSPWNGMKRRRNNRTFSTLGVLSEKQNRADGRGWRHRRQCCVPVVYRRRSYRLGQCLLNGTARCTLSVRGGIVEYLAQAYGVGLVSGALSILLSISAVVVLAVQLFLQGPKAACRFMQPTK